MLPNKATSGILKDKTGSGNQRQPLQSPSLGTNNVSISQADPNSSASTAAGSAGNIPSRNSKSLSEYAVNVTNLPADEWQIDANKDESLFQKGRDYQPRKQKHHFTEEEKARMATFESAPLKPSHTAVFRHWLASLPPRSDTESWLIIALIAVIIGIITFVMKMTCEKFQIFYNPFMKNIVERGRAFRLWIYYTGISCTCGAFSAIIIIYLCPQAGNSGVPEIIGVLNGVVVRNVLGVKTLVCKIVSTMFTVISGLPVGFEGPMIHIGGIVGALMARPCRCQICQDNIYVEKPNSGKEGCCNRKFRKICRYRDSSERQNLICVGSAAGVAAAFSSPITGLCFAMEELASHWSSSLTWQTFVCCILARSTTELLHSVTSTVEHQIHHGRISGIFELGEAALFDMKVNLKLNLMVFIPVVLIGVLGGLLGSLFIFMYLKMAKYRRRMVQKIKRPEAANAFKVIEVVILCFICSSLIMLSLPLFYCNRVSHSEPVSSDAEVRHLVLKNYNCKRRLVKQFDRKNFIVRHTGEFHEGATLLLGSWEQMIRNLLSRKTSDFFGITCISFILFFFFIFSPYAAMVSISSGLLVPQLVIGSLYGRLVGKCLRDILKGYMGPIDDKDEFNWDFLDPGGLAVLGAASFFVGTSRQPITGVIMMAELTNDINMSLLVMVSVMLAKFVGDRFTHSLVHSLLEFKCMPVLEPELKIYHNHMRVDLELFPISLVMAQPVTTFLRSSVYTLATLLLDTNHGAFPVEKPVLGDANNKCVFMGLISRMELTILLTKTEGFDINELNRDDIDRIRITYPEYTSTKLKDCAVTNKILQMYSSDTRYQQVYVNLYPYINLSSETVTLTFSLHRAYVAFRSLGLRHLVIVDEFNSVQGIVTRKDLLGFVVEEKVKDEIMRIKQRNLLKKHYRLKFQTTAAVLGKVVENYKSIIKKREKEVDVSDDQV